MDKATFPAIAQIDSYWEGLRNGRLMPTRAEVDPRGMEAVLEYAMLLEFVAPGVARVRVAGVHLSDLIGMDVRGMPLSVFFDPGHRGRVAEILDQVVRGPRVAELKLSASAGIGRPSLTARMYLAPLKGEREARPRLLGCLQSIGGIGRIPRRFAVDEAHTRRIVAAAETEPSTMPQPEPQQSVPGFAEPAASFEHASGTPLSPSERPYLRLVKPE